MNEANLGWNQNVLALVGFAVLLMKAFFFVFVFMWIRWTIPRFRYDQLMKLGWTRLIPLALLNLILTALISLWLNSK
ncbi:MAG: NADH-quinone oxidoreductase subunit H [Chitinophagaceae bacterium]|nr:NADH-quinone oxidoreductase subunit H [Chitinophagaceae bacterium]